ncbi:DNA helicase II [Acidiferrobacter sp.]|uniref:DNA helicase II n=1 Tax=Acidiferrobacter sp. TaxID=1872107 RepID=UPI00262BC827|nr:DNA helicase II [Acidiferrobacter sp.]
MESSCIEGLNAAQREAVTAAPGPLRVLAGAGSGKTRVLTHRIAWLADQGTSPFAFLAVTFTNKAAFEMRRRIEGLLRQGVSGLWIGTFHGLSHRFLRAHWREAGLAEAFSIIDGDDQQRLVKRLMRAQTIDESRYPPRMVQGFINGHKEAGRRARHVQVGADPTQRMLLQLYQAYETLCREQGLVDFAELLLATLEVMRGHPAIREHYQRRFRHTLVDEFQDTNIVQYEWLRLFGAGGHLFVVGDDDQSIYGWRGAEVENILRFERDYPGARTIRLEQNYRSTGRILEAANAVIAHNAKRLGKTLWTAGHEGRPVAVYAAYSGVDEAQFVVERIRGLLSEDCRPRDVAVLYRSNAQSRLFEELLVRSGIPYRVYGGLRFFDRAEIKDALAYLRLALNRDDDAAFERVVNVPARGIGARTIEALRGRARADGTSLWAAAVAAAASGALSGRAAAAIRGFISLVERLAALAAGASLDRVIETIIKESGLLDFYREEGRERGEARGENLEELVSAARFFMAEGHEGQPVVEFLAHAALEAGEGQAGEGQDSVQLMTLHAAKGLEFPVVFLTGLEEGLFPHERSLYDEARLEEERRLCYVGITRAMRDLTLSFAETRRLHGEDRYSPASRFLAEIPDHLLEYVRPRASAPASAPGRPVEGAGLSIGGRVTHATFGEGVVIDSEGQGAQARVQVQFAACGVKWLVLAYAGLTAL